MYLAADIGGTRSRFYAIDAQKIVFEHVYSSKDYTDFMDIVNDFLKKTCFTYSSFVFGIAGVVLNGVCKTTNLPWEVSLEKIIESTKISKGFLINDLQLLSYGIASLEPHLLETLQVGEKLEGPSLLVCPGTGLGVACALADVQGLKVLPTEAGHADFAAIDQTGFDMVQYYAKLWGHVSTERFVSGSGLMNVYNFLAHQKNVEPLLKSSEQITEAALAKTDLLAQQTCEFFLNALAATLGNLALHYIPYKGIYLSGALLRLLSPILNKQSFIETMSRKGRFQHLLKKIPVYLIKEQKLAARGAGYFFKNLEKRISHE